MKRKHGLLRIVFICYLLAPISCADNRSVCSDSCCGETFEDEFTKVDALTLTSGSLQFEQRYGYNVVDFIKAFSSNWEAAALSIEVTEIAYLARLNNRKESTFNFSFINRAVACSPPEPEPTQQLDSIIITSNKDLVVGDSTYESGTDISAHFSVISKYSSGENQSIDDFVIKQNDRLDYFGTYWSSLILKLNKYIMMPEQTLTVRVVFDDQSAFTLTTDKFKIE